jgi:tetratricopeptide (TPR) repeat protein
MKHLESLARRLIDAPSQEAELALRAELSGLADRQMLRDFGEQFIADPEVSIPTFERLVELAPEDIEARVSLGLAFWQMGEDDVARSHLEQAKALDPEHLQVLTLEVALTEEPTRLIQLYRRILEKDPSNEFARNQIPYLMLEEPAQRLLDTHEPAARQDFLGSSRANASGVHT